MSTLGNVLWFIFGGLVWGLALCAVGLLCCVTVIGIPFGLQCFKIARLVFFPFGMEIRNKPTAGGGAAIGNVFWILIVGLWSGIGMFLTGLLLCITIIGIPFGLQYFKIAQLVLFPFGKEIVPKGVPYYSNKQPVYQQPMQQPVQQQAYQQPIQQPIQQPGQPVAAASYCKQCGASMSPEQTFCIKCGTKK